MALRHAGAHSKTKALLATGERKPFGNAVDQDDTAESIQTVTL